MSAEPLVRESAQPSEVPPGLDKGEGGVQSGVVSKRRGRTLLFSVLIVVGFAWILRQGGLPLLPPEGALAKTDVGLVVAFCLLMLFHTVTRYLRVHFLIAPIGTVSLRSLMSINAIAGALIVMLPLRLGELTRPAMLRGKGQLSAWAVTGTVAAERILDGVVFSALLIGGLAIASPQDPLPTQVGALKVHAALIPNAARVASLAFGLGFVVMIAYYLARDTARRVTLRVFGVVSEKLAQKLADIVDRSSSGFRFLAHPRHTLLYLAVTLLSIGSQIWSVDVLAAAVGMPELDLAQATVVLGVLALGFALPNAPGFFGMIQLALYAGLVVYIAPEKVAYEGAAFVFLFYVAYLGIILLLAALAVAVDYLFPARTPAAPQ